MKPILTLDNITVTFDGFKAIKNVNTAIHENEIRFFIGPNGAGKTTLLDVICGRTHPSEGKVIFNQINQNQDLCKMSEHEIVQLGIGRKFQVPSIFPGITIQENMELAAMKKHSLYSSIFGKLSKEKYERIQETLQEIGLYDLRYYLPTRLSHGQKQWLEIGMLFVSEPRLMLLDEPVAGMGRKETEKTSELIKRISKECTVVIVEHDMEFVRDCSTDVTVLHEGAILDEGKMADVEHNQKVIDVYLGRGGDVGA